MDNKAITKDLIDFLLEHASDKYRLTPTYKEYRTKQLNMIDECKANFTKEDNHYIQECFVLITESCETKMEYLYIQGLKDCYIILKELALI